MARDEFWRSLEIKGVISIASRMKKISDLLFQQVQEIYDYKSRDFNSSWFAIMATIRQEGRIDSKTLADRNNVSAPAISRTIKKLESIGMIEYEQRRDRRSKFILLTEKGIEALDSVSEDLLDIKVLLEDVIDYDHDLLTKLDRVESKLNKTNMLKGFKHIEDSRKQNKN